MKTKKEALRSARLLLKAVMQSGSIDGAKVRDYTQRIIAEKPRHYVAILESFARMLRLEQEKRHAVVETATAISSTLQQSIVADLKAKHGADLTSEFRVTPDLLGGLRVKIGSNVFDGSVKAKLDALSQSFAA